MSISHGVNQSVILAFATLFSVAGEAAFARDGSGHTELSPRTARLTDGVLGRQFAEMMGGMQRSGSSSQGMPMPPQGGGMQGRITDSDMMDATPRGGRGQATPVRPHGDDMPMPDPMTGMPMQGQGAIPLDRIEGRVAFMHAELGITQAQEPLWDKFANALRGSRQHLQEARQALGSTSAQISMRARLAAYEKHLAERLAALQKTREALDNLYASLDDAQQRAADEVVAPLLSRF